MQLTIDEAASRLGKSALQVRYMIQNGRLPARKISGRWTIDAADLPLSEGQRAALARRERALLRLAVESGSLISEQYGHVLERVNAIGRQLGGWRRKLGPV